MGRYDQLLPRSVLEDHFFGRYFHLLDGYLLPSGFVTVWRSRTNPVQNRLVVCRTHLKPDPAFLRHTKGGLQHHQALFGLLHIDARMLRTLIRCQHPEGSSLHNRLEILSRIDAIHREPESAASFHTTMTRRVVATPLGQYS